MVVNTRALVTTALEIAGIAAVAFGCWLLLPAAGIIVGGLGLVLIGWRLA